jgi:uncharacterized coiled-coil protein SlyX
MELILSLGGWLVSLITVVISYLKYRSDTGFKKAELSTSEKDFELNVRRDEFEKWREIVEELQEERKYHRAERTGWSEARERLEKRIQELEEKERTQSHELKELRHFYTVHTQEIAKLREENEQLRNILSGYLPPSVNRMRMMKRIPVIAERMGELSEENSLSPEMHNLIAQLGKIINYIAEED